MSGPCLCGDPYCGRCFPGAAAEAALEGMLEVALGTDILTLADMDNWIREREEEEARAEEEIDEALAATEREAASGLYDSEFYDEEPNPYHGTYSEE